MKKLDDVRGLLKANKTLAEFDVQQVGDELHLYKGDTSFARLIPVNADGQWRIEYFHNEKRWERIDFVGDLEACIDLLAGAPHYLYWET